MSAVSPAVEDIDLLQFASPEVRELVTASFEPRRYTFGEVIVREGDDADAFYVLTSGRIDLTG